jgi:hypothetical protein
LPSLKQSFRFVTRNKEHMIQIDNEILRRRVRDFFNGAVVNLAVTKDNLARLYEANRGLYT